MNIYSPTIEKIDVATFLQTPEDGHSELVHD